ncbi:MAG: CTB family bacteriocin [Desmonostoc vinosum HA7617-LM4]|nr:CTB family bacteriocin [Desmonostoc vinosum HA7617-LM4]MBW4614538.1 CTB family bacteriocin [Desmonostoc vinosum HA7617-LM4]
MSHLTMQSELFIDLSNEQEEIVSGGIDFKDLIATSFSQESLGFATTTRSGKGGSEVMQLVTAEKSYTDALKDFMLKI